MRTLRGPVFSRLSSPQPLFQAYWRYRKGKARSKAVATFDLDADRALFELSRRLQAGQYTCDPWRLKVISDPKTRLISAPSVRDRVLHRAVLDEIGPFFDRTLVACSYAGRKGMGTHRAVFAYLRCVRRYRYRLHLDIRQYFPSIHHDTLLALLTHRIADAKLGALLKQLIKAGGRVYQSSSANEVLSRRVPKGFGLPLGSALSQWAGGFYLNEMDHLILRQWKPGSYLRYMDDFVLFDDDKQRLERLRSEIQSWLWEQRSLELNPKRWCVFPNSDPGVFLGYRVSRAGISPSRKLKRRFRSRVRLAASKGDDALMRTLTSYRGLLGFG